MKAKFVHTNLVARDWKKLAEFYINVFGCELVPPERNYSGEELEKGAAVNESDLQGVHLRLPGYDSNGPTLEIYSYSILENKLEAAANRLGFGHIAFEVEDVESAYKEVISNGGSALGEIVRLTTKDNRIVTWVYVKDPEDNIIELQSWSD